MHSYVTKLVSTLKNIANFLPSTPPLTRVVQYTRTVTVRISHVSIRTDRTDRQQGYTVFKECFTVRKSHLISGT